MPGQILSKKSCVLLCRKPLNLTLAEVHAAMGYYYDHQTEIDAEIAAELAEVDRVLKNPARSAVWLKLKAKGLIP